jgi:hypothetical protein
MNAAQKELALSIYNAAKRIEKPQPYFLAWLFQTPLVRSSRELQKMN